MAIMGVEVRSRGLDWKLGGWEWEFGLGTGGMGVGIWIEN